MAVRSATTLHRSDGLRSGGNAAHSAAEWLLTGRGPERSVDHESHLALHAVFLSLDWHCLAREKKTAIFLSFRSQPVQDRAGYLSYPERLPSGS